MIFPEKRLNLVPHGRFGRILRRGRRCWRRRRWGRWRIALARGARSARGTGRPRSCRHAPCAPLDKAIYALDFCSYKEKPTLLGLITSGFAHRFFRELRARATKGSSSPRTSLWNMYFDTSKFSTISNNEKTIADCSCLCILMLPCDAWSGSSSPRGPSRSLVSSLSNRWAWRRSRGCASCRTWWARAATRSVTGAHKEIVSLAGFEIVLSGLVANRGAQKIVLTVTFF